MSVRHFIVLSFNIIREMMIGQKIGPISHKQVQGYSYDVHVSDGLVAVHFKHEIQTTEGLLSKISPVQLQDVTTRNLNEPLQIQVCLKLQKVCMEGSVDQVNHTLSKHPRYINCRGTYSMTPVMLPAGGGRLATVQYLVSEHCDVALADDRGYTVLHYGCIGGRLDIVRYLLSHTLSDIERKDKQQKSSVMLAAALGYKELFNYLVDRGARLDGTDVNNSTILHLACSGGSIPIVKHLFSHNITGIENKGKLGRTPIMYSARAGHYQVFRYLIDIGCDLTVIDDQGGTILHNAVVGEDKSIITYILSLDDEIDINKKNNYGFKAEDIAESRGQHDIVQLIEVYKFVD